MIGKCLRALMVWACFWPSAALAQPPQPPPAQKAEPAPSEPPSPLLHYTLAAIGTLIVVLLVCMPARRE